MTGTANAADAVPVDAVDDHPRPQLRRAEWTDLSGEWEFDYDDADVGLAEHWERGTRDFGRRIVVPYPPESPLSTIGDTSFHRVLWYRRRITVDRPDDPGRLLVHFGAVDYAATVWLDGSPVARHEGGHTPFTADITDALGDGREHTLTVRVTDDPADVTQPRGKQAWRADPHAIWYHRTSGIWQPVWMETVADLHIQTMAWAPDLPNARVELRVSLSRKPTRQVPLSVRLHLDGRTLAEQRIVIASDHAQTDIALPALRHGQDRGRLLWSPESPTLIDAHLVLGDGDAGHDEVSSYVGLRSAGFRDGRFMLNGAPYYLRLVLEQGFWPGSHLAAPDAAALRTEVELIRSLGFNGTRIHQKAEDPRFLGWCDRIGLLVWGEMPSAYEFGERTVGRLTREWLEVLRRDASHPCVVTWVPLNESWGVPDIAQRDDQRHFASALYHLTRAVDGSRPVVSNDGWEHTVSDLWTVHDYDPDGAGLRQRYGDPEALKRSLRGSGPGRRRVLLEDGDERGQPVVLSEFGGLSFAPEAGQQWFGYGVVGSAEDLAARLTGLVETLLDCPEIAGFCYTQLTDTMQERNGLLTEDRKPKLPLEWVRELITRPSRAIPAETVDAHRRRARAVSE